jgi:hypothetical protein
MAALVFLCVINLSTFTLCRLPLPPPPPGLAVATSMVVAAGELQELLLAREEELTRREEALAAREEKARVSENALGKVSVDHNAERAKAKATQKVYLDKMAAHTTHAKHTLDLDKMLGEKKVELDGTEWDLNLHEVALVEDNCDKLMLFIEL